MVKEDWDFNKIGGKIIDISFFKKRYCKAVFLLMMNRGERKDEAWKGTCKEEYKKYGRSDQELRKAYHWIKVHHFRSEGWEIKIRKRLWDGYQWEGYFRIVID